MELHLASGIHGNYYKGNGEDIPIVGNVCPSSDKAEELKLRDYQEEVLTPALKGQNAMVVLPTGTGKTEVAIALISRRFLARNPVGATNHRRQKSVFVVNKVRSLIHISIL